MTWKGISCTIIDLQGMCVIMEQAIPIMSAVPQSGIRQCNLSGLPYHVLLKEAGEQGSISKNGQPTSMCRVYGENVDEKIMRKHVGKHILKEKLENVCGFCDLGGCTIQLVSGSDRGKSATMIAESNCPYKKKKVTQSCRDADKIRAMYEPPCLL